MKKLMMAVVVAAGAASALAMPTKEEMAKAQPLVAELMAPAMAKYKAAGYKEKAAAAAKVGDASSEFAKAAETEAAKFLLLKGAVNFYTRGEQYDKAADMIAELQREVKDVPPAVIAEITGKATGKISEAKAPKLYAIYRSAKLQVRAADEAKALAAKLKKAKSDALQRKYAEALAMSGDWKMAYAEFAKVSDAKLKEIAAAEAAGNAKSAESGEFWWAYDPAFEDADDFFKSHAAAYYRKALDSGEITGLKKTIVEQRIAGIAAEVVVAKSESSGATKVATASSPSSPDAPSTGKAWQEKGNTAWLTLPNGEQIKFVKCPKGKFNMLYHYAGSDPVTFPTKMGYDFWISDRIMTHAYEAGVFPEKGKPTDDNSRKRGFETGDSNIDAFVSRLQDDYGGHLPSKCVFRLPSIAEFEYAYHANTKDRKDPYFYLSPPSDEMRKSIESLGKGAGENSPNAWGIHDMLCYQRFLDRLDETDLGQHEPDRAACFKNGFFLHELKVAKDRNNAPFFWSEKDDCYVMWTWHGNFQDRHVSKVGTRNYGFHLVVGPDLVGEWKAKHGKK